MTNLLLASRGVKWYIYTNFGFTRKWLPCRLRILTFT